VALIIMMMIIITLSMPTTIGAIMITMITILVDRTAANADGVSVGFDERLQKHPHPCRKSR
jgi:hypothetical protein